MSRNNQIYIDINKTRGLPRTYRFNPFVRWFTIFLASFCILYAGWFIFAKVASDTTTWIKVFPFVIIFFAANSLMRNLFSINAITFTQQDVSFRFIARKRVTIPWEAMRTFVLANARQRQLKIGYEINGEAKDFPFSIAFPRILEVVNAIYELAPQVELDEYMSRVIINKEEADKQRRDAANADSQ
jgi:hypothetical protein